jgi:hypothetical protein
LKKEETEFNEIILDKADIQESLDLEGPAITKVTKEAVKLRKKAKDMKAELTVYLLDRAAFDKSNNWVKE